MKKYTNDDSNPVPTNIIINGKNITSPKQLATKFNDHFIEKVEKIRNSFVDTDDDPIELLELLVEKPSSTFVLPEITLDETYEIIDSLKASNSSGFDEMNSKIIKKIPHISAIMMTHLINTSGQPSSLKQ